MIRLFSASDIETEALGAALARSLPSEVPPRALRVYLRGDLGAGKTTLARGLLRGLGVEGRIKSPTYSLLEVYAASPWQVLHLDLYRLSDPDDVAALGLADHDIGHSLWLIEWPERAHGVLPQADLDVHLCGARDGHEIVCEACSSVGSEWLNRASSTPEFSPPER